MRFKKFTNSLHLIYIKMLAFIGVPVITVYITCFNPKNKNFWALFALAIVGLLTLVNLDSATFNNKLKVIGSNEETEDNGKPSINYPGQFALFFATIFQEHDVIEYLVADIIERYSKDIKKHGIRTANKLLWKDNFRGLFSAVQTKIIKKVKSMGIAFR